MKPIRIGDPHIGKVFKTGVPLNRRGEREKTQRNDLIRSLMSATAHLHINMGDLFDEREVPYEDVLFVAREYKRAAEANPNSEFVVERGNHDASRTVGQASAYDVFAETVRGVKNIHVVENEPIVIDQHLIIPWHPFLKASEMVPKSGHFRSANGHWDVRCFDEENPSPNMVPTERLAGITSTVFTGHEHKPSVIRNDATGFEIVLVGSMQPYAFGEEATPKDYLTLTLDEAERLQGTLHDKTVRLLLRPGEKPPTDLDCRQLIIRSISEDLEVGDIDVNLADFDLRELLAASCAEHNVNKDNEEKLWSHISAN